MSLIAIIPVADLLVANSILAAQGHGEHCFSVPAYGNTGATHAALHAWDDPVFSAHIKALPGVVTDESEGDPVARTKALIEAQGAQWGSAATVLPSTGNVTVGALYQYVESDSSITLWSVIQTFNRTTYSAHPSTYPALIRQVRVPGSVEPWRQPIDQYDAYKTVSPFTGEPDKCTHNGQDWYVSAADENGNNIWEPGVFGWTVVGQEPAPIETWVDTGVTIAQLIGSGIYRVSGVPTIDLNQAVRLGDLSEGETVFTGYWPTTGTPSDYIKISPHVAAANGSKVWKWA